MNKRTAFSTAAVLAIATAFANAAFAEESKSAAPAASPPAAAAVSPQEITKEQAVEMALKAHPGEVTKAYKDTKNGKKAWEVKIKGDDGKKWEVYYDIKTGELVAEDAD